MNTKQQIKSTILENAQRGSIYRIGFERDEDMYVGIPVALPGVTPESEARFELKVLQPGHKRGIIHACYADVVRMERMS